MSNRRRRGIASSLLATSLLLMMMSISGSWGTVYGQSGGPTPTVVIGIVSPGGGAEGEDPGRNQVVAGESAEASESVEVGNSPARPELVAGESGSIDATALPMSGAESAVQWPLLIAGLVLFASGALIFRRTRSLQS